MGKTPRGQGLAITGMPWRDCRGGPGHHTEGDCHPFAEWRVLPSIQRGGTPHICEPQSQCGTMKGGVPACSLLVPCAGLAPTVLWPSGHWLAQLCYLFLCALEKATAPSCLKNEMLAQVTFSVLCVLTILFLVLKGRNHLLPGL